MMMRQVWQNLRYSLRALRKNPGFTAAAVLSLALGIGANTAIFTLINALLLRTLPVLEPQQIVWLGRSSIERNDAHSFPFPFYLELRDHNSVFSGLACYIGMTPALTANGGAERVPGELFFANYSAALEMRPYTGRFSPGEDERVAGEGRAALLTHDFWPRHLGAAPAIIGK